MRRNVALESRIRIVSPSSSQIRFLLVDGEVAIARLLERTGMRWTRVGAQSMLNLRCIEASEIWEPLMEEYRSVALHYDGGRKNYNEELSLATSAA